MIYTVTFNPSLDYVLQLEELQMGRVNRAEKEQLTVGGKGLNVSLVLGNLGVDSVAMGFVGGFVGDEIARQLQNTGCRTDFIRLARGVSRINVKLHTGQETEINGAGPDIEPAALQALQHKLDRLQTGDVLVLAGSIPRSLPDDIYQTVMARLQQRGVDFVVDATGRLLSETLRYRPFLIKPNHHELAERAGRPLDDDRQRIAFARQLQKQGARNVLVSMAGDGALLCAEDGAVYKLPAPQGKVVNSVGAGDSMVAGFLAGWQCSGDCRQAFCWGVAAGSASAFSPGLATRSQVEALRGGLRAERL